MKKIIFFTLCLIHISSISYGQVNCNVQLGLITESIPESEYDEFEADIGADIGNYMILNSDVLGELTNVEIRGEDDEDDPYLFGDHFDLTAEDNCDISVTFQRPGAYMIKTTRTDLDNNVNNEMFEVLYKSTPSSKKGKKKKTGKKEKIPTPNSDLVLISDSKNDNGYLPIAQDLVDGEVLVSDVDEAITAICDKFKANGNKPINVDILDHGAPGNQSIGAGDENEEGGYIDCAGGEDDFNKFVTSIKGKVGCLTFYGCNVAEGEEGKTFLCKVAEKAGVTMKGFTGSVYAKEGEGFSASDCGNSVTKTPPGETRSTENRLGHSFTTGVSYISDDFDIAVYRIDENGDDVWSKKYLGTGYNSGWGISTDIQGNSVVTGEMTNVIEFDTKTLSTFGGQDIFLVKNDKDGQEQWVRQAGSTGKDGGLDIVIDKNGNNYIVGYYSGKAYFEGEILSHEGTGGNGFIAKYNSNGLLQWVRSIGGNAHDEVRSIALSSDGYLYLTGSFSGQANFGTHSLQADNNKSLFLSKMNTDGKFLWAKKYENNAVNIIGKSLVTDILDNVIIIGTEDDQMLMLKYNSSGTLLHQKHVQSTGFLKLSDVTTVGQKGHVQVVGIFTGDIFIDGQTIENLGGQDIFLAEFNSNLSSVWVKGEGGPKADYALGIHNAGSGFTSYVGCTFGTSTVNDITQIGNSAILYRRFDTPNQTTTALPELALFSDVTIAPNPFVNTFYIDLQTEEQQAFTVELFDRTGRRISQRKFKAIKGNNRWSISNNDALSKGLYLLKITNEKGQHINRKLIHL